MNVKEIVNEARKRYDEVNKELDKIPTYPNRAEIKRQEELFEDWKLKAVSCDGSEPDEENEGEADED